MRHKIWCATLAILISGYSAGNAQSISEKSATACLNNAAGMAAQLSTLGELADWLSTSWKLDHKETYQKIYRAKQTARVSLTLQNVRSGVYNGSYQTVGEFLELSEDDSNRAIQVGTDNIFSDIESMILSSEDSETAAELLARIENRMKERGHLFVMLCNLEHNEATQFIDQNSGLERHLDELTKLSVNQFLERKPSSKNSLIWNLAIEAKK